MATTKGVRLGEIVSFPKNGNPAGDRIPNLSQQYTVFPEPLTDDEGKPIKGENGEPDTTQSLWALAFGGKEQGEQFCKLLEKHQPDICELAADIAHTKGLVHETLVSKSKAGLVLWSGCRRYLACLYLSLKANGETEIPARILDEKEAQLEVIGNSANNYKAPALFDRGDHWARLKREGLSLAEIAKRCVGAKFSRSKNAATQEVSRGIRLAENVPPGHRMRAKFHSGEIGITKLEEWVEKQLHPTKKKKAKTSNLSKKHLKQMLDDVEFFRKQYCTKCPVQTIEILREFIALYLLEVPYLTLEEQAAAVKVQEEEYEEA